MRDLGRQREREIRERENTTTLWISGLFVGFYNVRNVLFVDR